MAKNESEVHGATLAHIYGVTSILCGVIGLLLSLRDWSSVHQWLLVASGWLVASFLAWFLVRSSDKLTNIIEKHDTRTSEAALQIGQLEERVTDLQKEIDRRHATLDYLSSLLITGTAIPRRSRNQEDSHTEDA
ncbi:hypothetical protein ABFG95_06140 [Achromobacter sp. HNDS-1]|uniref:Uncharacterized protein n=1 Tax=Achromobacter sp. HNDS-1 TaxID=3151598 RepID=A0AAU7LDQ4_9BURK